MKTPSHITIQSWPAKYPQIITQITAAGQEAMPIITYISGYSCERKDGSPHETTFMGEL